MPLIPEQDYLARFHPEQLKTAMPSYAAPVPRTIPFDRVAHTDEILGYVDDAEYDVSYEEPYDPTEQSTFQQFLSRENFANLPHDRKKLALVLGVGALLGTVTVLGARYAWSNYGPFANTAPVINPTPGSLAPQVPGANPQLAQHGSTAPKASTSGSAKPSATSSVVALSGETAVLECTNPKLAPIARFTLRANAYVQLPVNVHYANGQPPEITFTNTTIGVAACADPANSPISISGNTITIDESKISQKLLTPQISCSGKANAINQECMYVPAIPQRAGPGLTQAQANLINSMLQPKGKDYAAMTKTVDIFFRLAIAGALDNQYGSVIDQQSSQVWEAAALANAPKGSKVVFTGKFQKVGNTFSQAIDSSQELAGVHLVEPVPTPGLSLVGKAGQ